MVAGGGKGVPVVALGGEGGGEYLAKSSGVTVGVAEWVVSAKVNSTRKVVGVRSVIQVRTRESDWPIGEASPGWM